MFGRTPPRESPMVGTALTFTITFTTKVGGIPTNPLDPLFTLVAPDGTSVTYNDGEGVNNPSPGVYVLAGVPTDQAGQWSLLATSTETLLSADQVFVLVCPRIVPTSIDTDGSLLTEDGSAFITEDGFVLVWQAQD